MPDFCGRELKYTKEKTLKVLASDGLLKKQQQKNDREI